MSFDAKDDINVDVDVDAIRTRAKGGRPIFWPPSVDCICTRATITVMAARLCLGRTMYEQTPSELLHARTRLTRAWHVWLPGAAREEIEPVQIVVQGQQGVQEDDPQVEAVHVQVLRELRLHRPS